MLLVVLELISSDKAKKSKLTIRQAVHYSHRLYFYLNTF